MDIPDDQELEAEFNNFLELEDYSYDDYRFQQQERDEHMDEERERQERRKRAKWLNNYYDFKDIQKKRRTQTNTPQNQQTSSNTTTPLSSEYESELESTKNAWAKQFIDETAKSTQFVREYHGVQVVFPKDPYPQQEQYVRKGLQGLIAGQNCFLQSPTGTGKTFCNLIASLGFILWQKRISKKHIKIIYLSRTHSQLQQVVKELQQTCYRPTMTIMGSRQHACINDRVNNGQFKGHDLIEKCNESRSAYFKLKKMDKDAPYQQEEIIELCNTMCPHFKERYQTVKNCQQYHNKVMQLEDFKEQGKGCFCPYFYPLYMEDHCDLFLMPYNYLLDVRLFERYADLINNSILIFDEAHNVADACCEGRSFQARFSMLDGFCKEIQALEQKDPKYSADKKVVESIRTKQMKDKLAQFRKEVSNLKETILGYLDHIPFHRAQQPQIKDQWPKLFYQGDQKQLKWSYVVSSSNVEQTLVQLVMGLCDAQLQLYRLSWPHRLQYNARTVERLKYIIRMKDQIYEEFKSIKGYSFFNINQTCRFLDRIVYLFETHKNSSELSVYHDQLRHYCLVFNVQLGDTVFESNGHRNIADYRISLNCLVPWFTFKEIQSCKPYSIFFTSGTMKPIQEWKHELNIRGKEFVNKHVIEDHQILLNIISHNQDQEVFNFQYQYMDPKKNNLLKRYEQMLKMIVTLLRQIPGGALVIFPNYKYVENTKNYLNFALCRFKEQIKKRVFFEQRGSLQQINDYKNYTKNGGQGVLFGVCRGKASEGIDFPDQQCRAVIFIGIPYQNAHTPLLMEKKIHYKKYEGSQMIPELKQISWGSYYFNSTIRAINQGLGRVIRHKYDYGQLFLLDCRFLERQKWYVKRKGWNYVHFRDYLPSWATKKCIGWGDDPDEIRRRLSELRTFYQYNRVHTVRPN